MTWAEKPVKATKHQEYWPIFNEGKFRPYPERAEQKEYAKNKCKKCLALASALFTDAFTRFH